MRSLTILCLTLLQLVSAFVPASRPGVVAATASSTSRLFAHHPQKKIIKKKMHNRPKKHRLSDINRKNVNFGKCITKLENAPADYTIVAADEYTKVRANALSFWEIGSSSTEWIDITDADMAITFSQNVEPLPVGGVQKKPSIVKSGSC
jgi:hypothetical protein